MANTVLELRAQLETALLPWLGIYTLANGATTPAMSVRGVGQGMIAGTRVSGIEAVLQLHPVLDPVRQYQDQEAIGEWSLYLVDWEGTSDLTGAAQKVIREFPASTYAELSVPEELGPSNQIKITIRPKFTMAFVSRGAAGPPAANVTIQGQVPSLIVGES